MLGEERGTVLEVRILSLRRDLQHELDSTDMYL